MLPTRTSALRPVGWALATMALAGCEPTDSGSTPEATSFSENQLTTGRVVENSTACEVDAVCYLRIEFADTSIVAMYGTGERPPPPCSVSTEVSNTAFPPQQGDLVHVVISKCGADGYYLRRLTPATG